MKWMREPLVHFVVAGALIFAGYTWRQGSTEAAATDAPVRIGPGEIRWMSETFASQWRRQPSADELSGLIETLVSEQLLAREARALGLDVDDTVVRRRLAQKLEFMIEDTARIGEPDDAALRAHYDAHPAKYRSEPRLSFEHIFFSAQRRPRAEADAASALTTISTKVGDSAPQSVGDPLPLAPSFANIDHRSAAAMFGTEFADAVFDMSPGEWRGPLPSAFGFHIVRVTAQRPSSRPPFMDVRDAILADVRRARSAETRLAFLASLRAKYGVEIEGQPQ